MKNKKVVVIIAVLAVIVILGGALISGYNGLVTSREAVESAESNIDTYLQRRADLIPNVVSTVKSFAQHETEVFDKVVEAYPELKSDATYVALMDELEGSENRIAVARKDYNDAVKDYNNKVIRFPGSIVANLFGFEKAEYFEASEEALTVPDVGEVLGK